MAKKVDAKALKEQKQKRLVAILLVVMLAALAFSIPKTMKMLNQSSATAAPPPAATTAAPAPAAPADAAATGAAAVAAGAAPTLVVSSAGTTAGASAGQLVSFERFAAKDPFVQQLGAVERGGGAAAGAAPSAAGDLPAGITDVPFDAGDAKSGGATIAGETGGSDPAAVDPVAGAGAAAGAAPPAAAPPATPVAEPTTASISVNGDAPQAVGVDGTFPVDDPIFRLVELVPTGAKIAIVGGDYEDGAESIVLTVGRPLTLMNTADGTRYEILLISLG